MLLGSCAFSALSVFTVWPAITHAVVLASTLTCADAVLVEAGEAPTASVGISTRQIAKHEATNKLRLMDMTGMPPFSLE
jgi:hypothetical protein